MALRFLTSTCLNIETLHRCFVVLNNENLFRQSRNSHSSSAWLSGQRSIVMSHDTTGEVKFGEIYLDFITIMVI